MPMLAGLPISDELTLQLAEMLHAAGEHATAEVLVTALEDHWSVVALTIPHREAILSVLEDPPAGLEDLCAVLLREHEWRRRAGLSG